MARKEQVKIKKTYRVNETHSTRVFRVETTFRSNLVK